MHINYPAPCLDRVLSLIRNQNRQRNSWTTSELHRFVKDKIMPALEPLFRDEQLFLEDLSDILQRSATGEDLTDSQKLIFRRDEPFNAAEEAQLEYLADQQSTSNSQ